MWLALLIFRKKMIQYINVMIFCPPKSKKQEYVRKSWQIVIHVPLKKLNDIQVRPKSPV